MSNAHHQSSKVVAFGAGQAAADAGSTGSPTDAVVPGIAAGCRGAIAAAGSTTTCRTCPGSGWMTMHMGSGAEVAPWEVIGRWGCITGGEWEGLRTANFEPE